MSIVAITDTTGNSGSVTVESYDVADAIRGWYLEAPAEVEQAIADLQAAINRDDHAQHELAEFLALTVESVPAGPRVDLIDPARAEYIDETLSVPVHVVGGTVVLSAAALLELSALDEHVDGHYDGTHIWIGGTEYAVVK